MAEETTSTEQTLDQQLETLFGTSSDAPAPGKSDGKDKAATDKPGSPAPSPADSAAKDGKEGQPATGEDPLEKALNDIKDDEQPKEEEKQPQLTGDQQAVLQAIPTPEVAQRLFGVVQNYQNFTQAFENGDFENVEAMFNNWNSAIFENFLEYIYDKHMVNGDWTERFIAEAEGRGGERKGIKALEAKIAKLEKKQQDERDQQQQGNTKAQQEAENKRVAQAYENYVTGLFDKIEFNKSDRKWVMQDMNSRVGGDPKLMQAVRAGNLSALNTVFKSAVREYVNSDKQVAAETDKKVADQSKHKAPISGGACSQVTDALPEDVKQVKKGQEENWMMQQLGNLFSKVGKKK